MNLALVGYGKMGRMLEHLAPEYGFAASLILDVNNNAAGEGFTPARFKDIAAAIEFTTPDAASANLVRLAELGVPTVCGTTGWFTHLDEVKACFDKNHTGFVFSPNFSIGVNVFQRAVAEAARLLAAQDGY